MRGTTISERPTRAGKTWDAAKRPAEQAFFSEHSANLRRLRESGKIVFGARYGEVGLIVVRAADEAEVQRELSQDPSIGAGTFAVTVERFRPFYGGCVEVPGANK